MPLLLLDAPRFQCFRHACTCIMLVTSVFTCRWRSRFCSLGFVVVWLVAHQGWAARKESAFQNAPALIKHQRTADTASLATQLDNESTWSWSTFIVDCSAATGSLSEKAQHPLFFRESLCADIHRPEVSRWQILRPGLEIRLGLEIHI